LLQHVVVDRNALVRQGIDAGDFSGEGGVGQMPKRKPLAFDERPHDFRSYGEIQDGRLVGIGWGFGFCNATAIKFSRQL
jgi:hypothetical protein